MKRRHSYLLLLAVFFALEIVLFNFVDQPVSAWVHELAQTRPNLINFFRSITDTAKSKWYLWPAATGIVIAFLLTRSQNCSLAAQNRAAHLAHHLVFLFSSIALSGIVTDTIKPILGRARPVEWGRHQMYGFQPFTFHASMNGMPSGHATTAAALAMVLTILYPRGRAIWWATGIFLAASRVMINAHYVSDVMAGSMVGILTTWVISRYRDRQGMFPKLNGIFPTDVNPSIS